ncbi:MAG: UvrD-helicase domain-containing protein, partial [Planctomycetota bacterium]
MTGPGEALALGLSPVADATSGRDDAFGRFLAFCTALFERLDLLAAPRPLAAWAARLDDLLATLFLPTSAEDRAAAERLRRVLDAASGQPTDDPFFAGLAALPEAAARCRRALADFDQVAVHTIHGFCKRLLDEAAFETGQPFRTEFETDGLPLLYRAAADALRLQHAPPGDVRGALLHFGKHTPDSLVQAYRLWRRHPRVALPEPSSRFRALADAVAAAAARASALWPEDLGAQFAAYTWNGGDGPLGGMFDGDFAQLGARLRRAPHACLAALLLLTPDALRKKLNKTKHKKVVFDGPFFAACAEVEAAVTAALAHLRTELLTAMQQRVEQGKREEHVATFDDLLVRAHAALRDPARADAVRGAIRARHQVALIDEFQDTDALQYAIFSTCFADRSLFLVGDPKQAIYGFRGADLRTYLRARGDAQRAFTLDANFRSAKALVAATTALFVGHPRPFVDAAISAQEVHAAAGPAQKRIEGDGEASLRWRWTLPTAAEAGNKNLVAQRICADVAADEAGHDEVVEAFQGWRARWRRHGVMALFAAFADARQVTARYLGWHDGERRLTNLRQLWELLHGAETAHRLQPEALLRWFEQE